MVKKNIAEQEAELKAALAALQKRKHPTGILEALNSGALPQGTRLVVPGAEEGVTIVFTTDEAKKMLTPLRGIIEARLAALDK